jgi:antitoxin component of RelBE/YafQ-DinJ toxin-antitoxin module
MEVIYIRIEPKEKEKLEAKAKELGLTLTGYCRMILIQAVK